MTQQEHSLTTLVNRSAGIDETSKAEDVLALLDTLEAFKTRLKEIDAAFKEQMIDWINANGDLVIGTKRYYVGSTKRTKPADNEALAIAAVTACEGDFAAFAEVLSANAFKPGACKHLLGDEWGQHFTVETVDDIKTGKPKKSVQMIDTKFLK